VRVCVCVCVCVSMCMLVCMCMIIGELCEIPNGVIVLKWICATNERDDIAWH
jgi:hypothetical protein